MHYFCEYHEHIRTLHLVITLESEPSDLTSLEIYDRKTLRLRHAFQSFSIALPASISTTEQLNVQVAGSRITCRIPASPIISPSGQNEVPLSSPEALNTTLHCTRCSALLIRGSGMTWKRMPSEHWVEMMDSWHCHRGVTDEHHHEHHDQYALPDHIINASERIRARPGTGLIGLSYLLITPRDTSDIITSLPLDTSNMIVSWEDALAEDCCTDFKEKGR